MSWDLLIVSTLDFLIAIPLKSTKHYLPIYKYYLHLKVIFTSNLEITIVVCSFPSLTSAYTHRAGASRATLWVFYRLFLFLSFCFSFFFFYQVYFFSPLSNRFEIRGRAGLGSAERLASGVPTLNKRSGSEIIVRRGKKQIEIQTVCSATLIPKVKNTKTPNLTPLPLLSVCVVVASATTPTRGWACQSKAEPRPPPPPGHLPRRSGSAGEKQLLQEPRGNRWVRIVCKMYIKYSNEVSRGGGMWSFH